MHSRARMRSSEHHGTDWYLYHHPGTILSPKDGEGLISPQAL